MAPTSTRNGTALTTALTLPGDAMRNSNTAIILILRDHMIPYRIEKGVPQVQAKDCPGGVPDSTAWLNVPNIISAMWVTGQTT